MATQANVKVLVPAVLSVFLTIAILATATLMQDPLKWIIAGVLAIALAGALVPVFKAIRSGELG